MSQLLILGGTTEARHLADAVCAMKVATTVSLAGETSNPVALSGTVRTGGFGGVSGLAEWLHQNHANAVIDATHPFAAHMPWHAHRACTGLCLPRLRLLRPPFPGMPNAFRVDTLQEAITHIATGKRVLVTTGRKETDLFRDRPDLTVHLRSIEPVPDLPANVTPLLMRPPFSETEEHSLLTRLQIDVLIAKDSGGVTAPKLSAAQSLGIDVLLLNRPNHPPGPTVQTVGQAVAWLRHVVGIGS